MNEVLKQFWLDYRVYLFGLVIGIILVYVAFLFNPKVDNISKNRDFCNNNGGNWSIDKEMCCIAFNSINRTIDKENKNCYHVELINKTYFFTKT